MDEKRKKMFIYFFAGLLLFIAGKCFELLFFRIIWLWSAIFLLSFVFFIKTLINVYHVIKKPGFLFTFLCGVFLIWSAGGIISGIAVFFLKFSHNR